MSSGEAGANHPGAARSLVLIDAVNAGLHTGNVDCFARLLPAGATQMTHRVLVLCSHPVAEQLGTSWEWVDLRPLERPSNGAVKNAAPGHITIEAVNAVLEHLVDAVDLVSNTTDYRGLHIWLAEHRVKARLVHTIDPLPAPLQAASIDSRHADLKPDGARAARESRVAPRPGGPETTGQKRCDGRRLVLVDAENVGVSAGSLGPLYRIRDYLGVDRPGDRVFVYFNEDDRSSDLERITALLGLEPRRLNWLTMGDHGVDDGLDIALMIEAVERSRCDCDTVVLAASDYDYAPLLQWLGKRPVWTELLYGERASPVLRKAAGYAEQLPTTKPLGERPKGVEPEHLEAALPGQLPGTAAERWERLRKLAEELDQDGLPLEAAALILGSATYIVHDVLQTLRYPGLLARDRQPLIVLDADRLRRAGPKEIQDWVAEANIMWVATVLRALAPADDPGYLLALFNAARPVCEDDVEWATAWSRMFERLNSG